MRLPLPIAARILACALPLAACHVGGGDEAPGIAGTGSGTGRTYAVSDFTGIEFAGSDEVDVRTGTGFSVRAEGPAEELEKLRITKDGDKLGISRKKRFGLGGGGGAPLKVFVTMPAIRSTDIAGSGRVTIDRVEGQSFSGASAGSGSLVVNALATDSADISTAGSGDITLGGAVKALSVDIAGSGNINARALTASRAKISVAGSGSVAATVNGPAEVDIMGSGNVDLGPNAQCKTSKMGSGDVRCGK